MPANVPLALTAKPRRIAPPAFAVGHHCCAVCAQRPRRDGPHHAPTRPRRRRADQRRLARHAMRVVSHAMRVASATPPRRVTGLHRRRCLTDHHPRVFARMAPRHGAMARTIARRRSVDPGPDACRPGRPRHALHCAASRPIAIPPQPPVDAHAPGPPHPRAMVPAMRVGDTPLRRQDDRPPTGQQRSHPVQPRLGTVRGHTAAGMCKDCPHQRPGAATGDARPAHHTVGDATSWRSRGPATGEGVPLRRRLAAAGGPRARARRSGPARASAQTDARGAAPTRLGGAPRVAKPCA